MPPKTTADGLERTFQTNYLGPFYLTTSLLPLLDNTSSRILNVSSLGHLQSDTLCNTDLHCTFLDSPANRFRSYCYSKLCLVSFSWTLSNHLKDTSSPVTVHCVDPGNTETNIYRHFPALSNPFLFYLQKPIRYFLIKTAREGAQGVLHAILKPSPVPFYIQGTRESHQINPLIYDQDKSTQLWRTSWQQCHQSPTQTLEESFPGSGTIRNMD